MPLTAVRPVGNSAGIATKHASSPTPGSRKPAAAPAPRPPALREWSRWRLGTDAGRSNDWDRLDHCKHTSLDLVLDVLAAVSARDAKLLQAALDDDPLPQLVGLEHTLRHEGIIATSPTPERTR